MKYRSLHINYNALKSTSKTSYFYKTLSSAISHRYLYAKPLAKVIRSDMRDRHSGFDTMTAVEFKIDLKYLVHVAIFRRQAKEIRMAYYRPFYDGVS
ncbi:MAG: hypothetical protein ACJ700_08575 [Nitrososphaera sp.]